MPEGDTLYRVARTLHRALAGHVVRRFDAAYAPLLRIHEEAPLVGRTVLRVESRGKWCLIWLGPREPAEGTAAGRWDGPLILCTHLRMNGMWHIYRAGRVGPPPTPDERWQRPARDMRVLLATDAFVAVGFRVPVAELLTEEELAGHRELGRLGPDLLGESFDAAEALRRLGARGGCALAEALLDQSAVAGIGNVYKSELCFLVGVSPFAPLAAVPPQTLRQLLSIAQRLLRENAHAPSTGGRDFATPPVITFTGLRRTTSAMNPGQRLWVYGRGGLPCRRCGTPIVESRQGEAARVTFHCPRCQPAAVQRASAEPV